MKFIDYEKRIRDSFPILIESYVSQYGEKYREHITSTLEKVKFCIYANPYNITKYLDRKEVDDYMKAVLDTCSEIGLDISKITLVDDKMQIRDEKLSLFIETLFGDINTPKGLLAFDEKYNFLDAEDFIVQERMKVLEFFRFKDAKTDTNTYMCADDYDKYYKIIKELLQIFKSKLKQYNDIDYDELYQFAKKIDGDMNDLVPIFQKRFFNLIKDYLSESDRQKLEDDQECDLRNLDCYDIYFDEDKLKDRDIVFAFATGGLIDYFKKSYTDQLMDDNTSLGTKKEIVEQRLKYLRSVGVDTKYFDWHKLCCDWYQLAALQSFLPSQDYLDEVLAIKHQCETDLFSQMAQMCVLNDCQVNGDWNLIDAIISGENLGECFPDVQNGYDANNQRFIVVIDALNECYNNLDVTIDHELRHIIETSLQEMEDGLLSCKTGVSEYVIDLHKSERRNKLKDDVDKKEEVKFLNYNEGVTEKLSIESTQARWSKKQYIFADKYAPIIVDTNSTYQSYLENIDIFFNSMREDLIDAQINADKSRIFKIIPCAILQRINDVIQDVSPKNRAYLNGLVDGLNCSKRERDQKVKRIGKREM